MKTIEDFYEALAHNEHEFIYRKKNGEIRKACGTTCVNLIPEDQVPTGQAINMSDDNKRYYDLNSNGWRSFNKSNILWTPFTGLTNNVTDDERPQLITILKA